MKARQLLTRHEFDGVYVCNHYDLHKAARTKMHRMTSKCYVPESPCVGGLALFCGVT